MKKIAVLGVGHYGYALLHHLDNVNHGRYVLTAWAREQEIVDSLRGLRSHPAYTDKVYTPLSQEVVVKDDLKKVIQENDILVMSVASQALRTFIRQLSPLIDKPVTIVSSTKAFDFTTGRLFSQVAAEELAGKEFHYAMLAGATIARDLVKGIPLGVTIGCADQLVLSELADIFFAGKLTVISTKDVKGVEVAASFKNVLSIFSGIIHGLGYPLETEIFAVTQMGSEVERLGVNKFGATRETFTLSSPCWGNDVWMSCAGRTRNREFGVLLGKKRNALEVIKEMEEQKKTTEGVFTILALHKITKLTNYPFLQFMHATFNGLTSIDTIEQLLVRQVMI